MLRPLSGAFFTCSIWLSEPENEERRGQAHDRTPRLMKTNKSTTNKTVLSFPKSQSKGGNITDCTILCAQFFKKACLVPLKNKHFHYI